MKRVLAFAAAVALSALPAYAASPLAALPIGTSVTYHVTSQANTPDGPQSASHSIKFMRATVNSLAVTVDGAPAGSIAISNGVPNVPPNLKSVLAPFLEVGLLLRDAPHPPAPGSQWAANVPVPVQGDTDNVAVTMTVQQIAGGRATIVASGSNATEVKPGAREFPANVSVNATMVLTAAHTIASANGSVSIVVHMGRRGREKNYGNSWTIAP